MAAIDKIYGTNAEYDELKAWVYEQRKSLLRYFYPRRLGYERVEPRAICNMPMAADVWLYQHCPLEWVRERIEEQCDALSPLKRGSFLGNALPNGTR